MSTLRNLPYPWENIIEAVIAVDLTYNKQSTQKNISYIHKKGVSGAPVYLTAKLPEKVTIYINNLCSLAACPLQVSLHSLLSTLQYCTIK